MQRVEKEIKANVFSVWLLREGDRVEEGWIKSTESNIWVIYSKLSGATTPCIYNGLLY